MAKARFSILLCALALTIGVGGIAPRASADTDECFGTSFDAVMHLPAPLRKWGQIDCTPYGHALGSRPGWVWASLENKKKVFIPSQMARSNLQEIGNESYFTSIQVSELKDDERASALQTFNEGLELKEGDSKAYRAELTSVSGSVITIYFFDFDNFAGGMWCPEDDCIQESRFLIMEQENKPELPSI